MRHTRSTFALVVLVGLVASGCVGALHTRPDPPGNGACALMAIGGVLRTDVSWGMGVQGDDKIVGVVWPYGWTLGRDPIGYVLLDRNGQPVAHEGDRILMAGTIFDGVLRPCDPPDLTIVEQAPR